MRNKVLSAWYSFAYYLGKKLKRNLLHIRRLRFVCQARHDLIRRLYLTMGARTAEGIRPACSEVAESEGGDSGSGESHAGESSNLDVVGVERSALESISGCQVSVGCGYLRGGSSAVVDKDGHVAELEGGVGCAFHVVSRNDFLAQSSFPAGFDNGRKLVQADALPSSEVVDHGV